MRLILARHGASDHGLRGVISDIDGCPGLTEAGQGQARRLAARLARDAAWRGSVLYASPVLRARQTADAVARALGVAAIEDPDLRELVPGEAEGTTWDAWRARHGFDLQAEPRRPFSPGGETWAQFLARAQDVLARLAAEHSGRAVVCATHAGFVVAAMLAMLDIRRPGRGAFLDPAHAAITEFAHEDGRWRLVRYNDGAHLERS